MRSGTVTRATARSALALAAALATLGAASPGALAQAGGAAGP